MPHLSGRNRTPVHLGGGMGATPRSAAFAYGMGQANAGG